MISGIFGLPGSGKSLLLGLLADRAVNHKSINYKTMTVGTVGKYDKVYTNFPFTGAYSLDFDKLGFADYHNCLILIDEIMMLADSRNFKNFGENLKFFFSMHRHFDIDLVYASQCYDDVDKKIRGVTDRLYYVDDSYFNFMRVRQIVSYFDVHHGRISEGYDYAPSVFNLYIKRSKLYDLIDTKAVINGSEFMREPVQAEAW